VGEFCAGDDDFSIKVYENSSVYVYEIMSMELSGGEFLRVEEEVGMDIRESVEVDMVFSMERRYDIMNFEIER
jgi:hypothetical protein